MYHGITVCQLSLAYIFLIHIAENAYCVLYAHIQMCKLGMLNIHFIGLSEVQHIRERRLNV